MERVPWSIREGEVGDFHAPEIMGGYRWIGEPSRGDFLVLPDGSGPWRVVDRMRAGQGDATENVLIVQLFGE